MNETRDGAAPNMCHMLGQALLSGNNVFDAIFMMFWKQLSLIKNSNFLILIFAVIFDTISNLSSAFAHCYIKSFHKQLMDHQSCQRIQGIDQQIEVLFKQLQLKLNNETVGHCV